MSTSADSRPEGEIADPGVELPDRPEGPVAAAVLAGGIGCFVLGLLTTLAEANASFKDWLSWNDDVGPLSGKTGLTVIVWLIVWAILHAVYRGRRFETRRALLIALILVALGVVGTFPTFFQAFTSE
ncbi:MAG TPA: hypothetical protein VFR13_00835 [Jiangellaceae bacterium]|nr:hypothetical protein [Jiangellaceae bacterium]